ncbi:MAG: sulfatase-like hydrolase/transferase [Nitrospiraceae bacterium]|nr:sulfatase-like hydrolase/transferase [Nitrospiraceae bacterium]
MGRASAAKTQVHQPNILLFLVDDMGWQDTSLAFWDRPTPFNEHFRTPHMERLARQGIRFTNAYAHAVCSPTRTSLMTGQSPVRHHVTNWTLRTDKDSSGSWGRVGPPANWRLSGLQPSDITLPRLLHDAGYFTIHCGKAHWGAYDTPGSDPLNLGFDINIAGHAAGGPGSYQGLENFGNKEARSHSRPWGVPGLEAYHGKDIHLTDALTTEAKAAVVKAVDAGRPFFLYMAHYAVHAPIQPHKRFMAHYTDRPYGGTNIDIPVEEERYASMVEGMDASLGELLAHLEALGQAENTLVVFTSDNGGLSAHARGKTPRDTGANTHNWPLKAGKGSAYEGGTRVPFIASWAVPRADHPLQQELPLKAGAVSKQPIISEDLFPTLLGVAGADAPSPATHPVDGRDVRLYLLQQESDPKRPLYFHYPHVWGPRGPGYEPHSAMRVGVWKVIYFYNPRRWELYNVEKDIGEEKNLAKARPRKLQKMAERMKTDLLALGVQWPRDRHTNRGEPILTPAELRATNG